MSSDNNTTPKKEESMGITFNEIHVDEPQEGVPAQKLESSPSKSYSNASHDEETSHLSNRGQLFNVEKAFGATGHLEAGTIVSDKKRSRPGFMENLKSAMHEWWGSTKESLNDTVEEIPIPKSEPKPTVAKVETRTEVVKKAAEKSVLAPKDDHKIVVQKIRTFKQDLARATNTPVVVKKPDLGAEPEWKHEKNKESGVSALIRVAPQTSTPATSEKKQEAAITLPKDVVKSVPQPPISPKLAPQTIQKISEPHVVPHPLVAPKVEKIPQPKTPFIVPRKSPEATPAKSTVSPFTVPPTITKKPFTPPPQSVIVPQKSSVDTKKVISAPIAPSWQNAASPKVNEPKPFIYTKKDLEKGKPFRFGTQSSVSGAVEKPPISVLKEALSTSGVIHESIATPKTVVQPPVSEKGEVSVSIQPEIIVPAPEQKIPQSLPSQILQDPGELKSMLREIIEEEFSKRVPVAEKGKTISTPEPTPPKPVVQMSFHEDQPLPKEPTPQPVVRETPRPFVMQGSATPPSFLANERFSTPPQIPEKRPIPRPMTDAELTAQREQKNDVYRAPPQPHTFFRITTRFAVFGIIAACGATLALVVHIGTTLLKDNATEPVALTIPSFFTTQTQVGIPLTGTPATFLTTVAEKISGASGATQFYPTFPEGELFRVATSKEILSFLRVRIGEKTIRALDDTMMVGSIQVGEVNHPFIIIRSYSFDTLFAGLLLWERNMQEDLAPLFGKPSNVQGVFVDAVRDNASTRILYEGDTEVLLYSFINQNTVVITTNGEALAAIIANF